MVLIFYNSVQDCFDCKSVHNFIYPKHYDFCNANVCQSLYYSTEYDYYYDVEDGSYELAEAIQNDGTVFSSYNDLLTVCLVIFIQIKNVKIHSLALCI